MKISVNQKLSLFAFIILTINGILGYAVYKSNQKVLDSEEWVRHAEQVIYQSGNIRSIGKEIEATSKCFVITNDSAYLEPFNTASKTAIVSIRQLRQLTRDNHGQLRRIDSLNFYMHNLLDFSVKIVKLRSMTGRTLIASTNEGRRYMDRISQIISSLQLEENILLKQRKQTSERSEAEFRQFSVIIFILITVFTILMVIIIGKYLFQSKEKEKRAAELDAANDELSFQNKEKEKRAAELKTASRLYAFISQVNQNIVRVKQEEDLFRNSCNIAIEFGKFKIAWIGLFDHANEKINLVDQCGLSDKDIKQFKNAPLLINSPQEHVLRTGEYYVCNDIMNNPELESWKPLAAKLGFYSCMILPIKKTGTIIGTFNLYSNKQDFSKKSEIDLLIEVAGDVSFALDIFEKEKKRKEAEALIVRNEKRFRALIEKSTDMITLSTKEGEMFYDSPSLTKVFGYSIKELQEMSYTQLIHPQDISEFIENKNKILNTPGNSFNYQHRRKHKSGYWIWCEGTLTNMLHEAGIHALVSNFRDISEKKINEQQKEFDKNNLNALINNTDDLMWSVDTAFNLITSNQPFNEFINLLSGKEIKNGGSVLTTKFPAEQLAQYKKFYNRAFNGESFSEVLYNAYPVEIWSEISYSPIRKGDQVIGAACHSRNITEKLKSERQLRYSEKFNRGVLNSLSTHIAVLDNSGTIVAVNDAWKRFAHENGDMNLKFTGVGNNYFNVCDKSAIYGEKDSSEALQGMKDVLIGTRDIFYLEYPCHSRYEKRWFGMIVMRFESDHPMIVVSHQNISERKLAEANLLQSESSLKEAQLIAHMGSFEKDIVNGTETWSDQMYKILGIENMYTPSSELLLSFVHQDDVEQVTKASRSRRDGSMDYKLIRKDGSLRYIYSEWKFEFDQKKKPVRLYGVLQDITERKHAETERIKIVDELTLRNKDLEQFAYIISHNLRAPVANIIGASSALGDPDLTSEDKDILSRGINVSINKLDNVVKDLNQILQVKGAINGIRETVNFSELVKDIKISINNLIDQNDITINDDFSSINELFTLKPYLYSIFYNLISNSVKYRRQDIPCIIDIRSRLLKTRLELVFRDNGIGIDLYKNSKQVFGLYKRFHTNIEGKGMGLFMVKTQVETLGGKISLKSEENKGTEFLIEFEK